MKNELIIKANKFTIYQNVVYLMFLMMFILYVISYLGLNFEYIFLISVLSLVPLSLMISNLTYKIILSPSCLVETNLWGKDQIEFDAIATVSCTYFPHGYFTFRPKLGGQGFYPIIEYFKSNQIFSYTVTHPVDLVTFKKAVITLFPNVLISDNYDSAKNELPIDYYLNKLISYFFKK